MKKTDVCLLFNFISTTERDSNTDALKSQGRYQVILFFDQNGKISESNIEKTGHKLDQIEAGAEKHIEFKTKEDLILFTSNFVEFYDYEQAYMLSTSDYNIGIESCHNQEGFQTLFKSHGTCLRNEKTSHKSLFSRLF